MPEAGEKFSIEFTDEGADELVAKSQKLAKEMNSIAAATERINKAGKDSAASQNKYLAQIKAATDELKQIEKFAGNRSNQPFWSQAIQNQKRVIEGLRKADRAEEAKTFKMEQDHQKEKHKGERGIMFEQRAHVRWISRAMQAVGMGRFSPSGSVGASVLGAMEQAGVGSVNSATGKVGLAGGMALGGVAVAGGVMALGGLSARHILAKSPSHQMGMELADYVNPFEANEKTRGISKMLQTIRHNVTNQELKFTGMLNGIVNALAMFAHTAGPKAEMFALQRKQDNRSYQDWLKIDPNGTMSAADRREYERKEREQVQAKIDAGKEAGAGFATQPTVSEVRYAQGLTAPMMGAYRPQTDMAKMGMYASVTEAASVRGQFEYQRELLSVLMKMNGVLDELRHQAAAGAAGGGPSSLRR